MTPEERAECMCEMLLSMQREIRCNKDYEALYEDVLEENNLFSELKTRIYNAMCIFDEKGETEKADVLKSVLYLIDELRGGK
jgi:hypothetical protein